MSPQPSREKTRDRNSRPRARARFQFHQTACWFSWLRALYKQKPNGSSWHRRRQRHVGLRDRRRNTHKKRVLEITLSSRWPKTHFHSIAIGPLLIEDRRKTERSGKTGTSRCDSGSAQTPTAARLEAADVRGRGRDERCFITPERRTLR